MTVLSATESDLERLSATDSPEGQSALALARAIDSGRSLMAVPAMVKELTAQLKAIRDAAPKKGDAVDDVLAAARAKRAGRGADTSGVQRTTKRRNVRG